jgi:hypothetical protein
MARLLRKLDRLDARDRRRLGRPGDLRRRITAVVVGIGLALAIGVTFANKQFGVTVSLDGLHKRTPLGAPPDVDAGKGTFEFAMRQPTDPARPVAYDPCRPIEYEVNAELVPERGEELIHEGVAAIEAATGLDFRFVGRTDRLPDSGGLQGQPVLIAWTTPDVVQRLEGDVAGVGGSAAIADPDTREMRYVTGSVSLDTPDLIRDVVTAERQDEVLAIIVHELGHLVGLAHVDDSRELMYDDNVGQTELGPGDREGLALLGSGRCY